MRIHSISNLLILPFAGLVAYILYRNFVSSDYLDPFNYLLLPALIAIVVLYLFGPQINHWWHKKNPPKLYSKITDWLEKYSTFYNGLSESNQERFRNRLSIYLESRSFTIMRDEPSNLPEDFKAIIAHNFIQLSFGFEDYLLDPYERVVVYNHAFPSPEKQFLHTVETNHEDGVLLFSLEHLVPGMLQKDKFYNIGMHGYIEAFMNKHSDIDWPALEDSIALRLELISNLTMKKVESILGFEIDNMQIIAINYFFTYPKRFAETLPGMYKKYQEIFKL